MSQTLPEIKKGQLLIDYINRVLVPWLNQNRVIAGNGIYQAKGIGGNMLTAAGLNVTVDLRGQLFGPYNIADGRFLVVDVATSNVTQLPHGTLRPSTTTQGEVWIDLEVTYGRVYVTRLG